MPFHVHDTVRVETEIILDTVRHFHVKPQNCNQTHPRRCDDGNGEGAHVQMSLCECMVGGSCSNLHTGPHPCLLNGKPQMAWGPPTCRGDCAELVHRWVSATKEVTVMCITAVWTSCDAIVMNASRVMQKE